MHDYGRAGRPKQSCEKMNGAGSRGRGRPVPAVSEIMGGRRFKLLPTNPTQLRLSSNYWAAFAEEANLGKTKPVAAARSAPGGM